MFKATKVRIYPTQEQAEFLTAQFGAVRFAYNKALHIKSHAVILIDTITDVFFKRRWDIS